LVVVVEEEEAVEVTQGVEEEDVVTWEVEEAAVVDTAVDTAVGTVADTVGDAVEEAEGVAVVVVVEVAEDIVDKFLEHTSFCLQQIMMMHS